MKEYEIDYKSMFENLSKRLDVLLKMDEEYFALIRLMDEQKRYTEIAGKHLFDFKKSEQIKALKLLTAFGALCKTLCEKYSLLDEEEGVDDA